MPTRHIRIQLPPLRPLQRLLAQQMRRWNVWVCHRRFGKTVLCLCLVLRDLFTRTLSHLRYAYVAPSLKQAKMIAWDQLKRLAHCIPGSTAHEVDLRVDFPNGARIYVLGANYPDSLRGPYWDGVILDEYAQIDPATWNMVLRPALADREGWAIKIGTPYGRNHFKADYDYAMAEERDGNPDYHTCYYRASETGVLPQAELDAMRQEMRSRRGASAGDAEYLQELECAWDAPVPGAVYVDELLTLAGEGRIGVVPVTPGIPVETCWDLGYGDSTAIWWYQQVGSQVHFIDYQEGSQVSLIDWVKVVRQAPYVYDHAACGLSKAAYERHFGPHDLEQTEYGSGKTRYGIALEQGLRFTVVPRGPLEDGIEATRKLLRMARFDAQGCAKGLEALRAYHYAWDDHRQAYSSDPYHDWSSHGADALRTGAVGLMQALQPLTPAPPPNSFAFWQKQLKRHRQGLPLQSYHV